MPKLLDPDCTFDAVLVSDQAKSDPPTFVFRALSVRAFSRITQEYDRLEDSQSETEKMNTIVGALKEGLHNWRNMGRDFNLDEIDEILTIGESIELLEYMLAGQQIDGDDAKN